MSKRKQPGRGAGADISPQSHRHRRRRFLGIFNVLSRRYVMREHLATQLHTPPKRLLLEGAIF